MEALEDLIALRGRLAHLTQYQLVEDYFGDLGSGACAQSHALKQRYRELILRVHPDRYCSMGLLARNLAEEVCALAHRLRALAEEKIAAGRYGQRVASTPQFVVTTRKRSYRVLARLARGDYADVYRAEYDEDGRVQDACLKIVRQASHNDLMDYEMTMLRRLQHKSLPLLLEGFQTSDRLRANVLSFVDGYDLYTLREAFPNGVGPAHVCWIMERLLNVVGYLHSQCIIHGNIEPGNILVRPADHNAFLIDFTMALEAGQSFRGHTDGFSAPEVGARKTPIPPSDLYSLGKCMVFLLGGDVATDRLPPGTDKRLVDFLRVLLLSHPLQRERDAWGASRRLSDLRKEIFGKRHQFLPFHIPVGGVHQVV